MFNKMFKLTILVFICLNSYHCYKQPMASGAYGGGAQNSGQQTISIPKPQAIIHLPENIYTHKLTDTIKLDHDQLSNYISSINYIPHTIHKHAEMLAQLDPADIQKYGQSVNSNQLPLISLTVPDSKSSEYNDAQMKMQEYPAAPQQNYASQQQPQSGSGYQQGGEEYSQTSPQKPQQSYGPQSPQQQSYSPSEAPRKNCDQDKNSDDYGEQENNSQEQYGSGGYDQGDSNENSGGYEDNNKSPEVEYQSGPQMDNYDSGNNDQSNGYYSENNGGGSYENNGSQEGRYENAGGDSHSQQNNEGYSNNQEQDYGKSNHESNDQHSGNYESSPFDYNFVQEILKHVMNQLEQLQIDPDGLSVYGKEDSNQGGGNGDYNSGGNENNYNSPSGYEVQGGGHGIQLVDRPEGAQEVSYGYSVNHGSSYGSQPAQNEGSNNYEPSYSSSSTRSQATSVQTIGEPAVILDNKIPINANKGHSTITYQMPTINLELPKNQIEHIMKAVSGKKGRYSQPIMVKANSFKLPPNLNLGKIKTIAFIKSSKLSGLKDLPPHFNTQILGSNVNSLNNYKIVSSTSKTDETKHDSNPVLSAYGYGVYASASNKKPTIVLPKKGRSKKRLTLLPYTPLQTASSNVKSIISALPKMNKDKKASSIVTPAVAAKNR